MDFEMKGKRYKCWNEDSRRARREKTVNFQSQIFDKKYKEIPSDNKDFLNTYIRMFQLCMNANLNWCWDHKLTELFCDILCKGSHLGETGKSRFLDEQIKCKVEKRLVKISLKYSELDDELIHWIDFFTSFIAILYIYEKYHESECEANNNEDFGYFYKKKP
jgi:hypothetical protein